MLSWVPRIRIKIQTLLQYINHRNSLNFQTSSSGRTGACDQGKMSEIQATVEIQTL